MRKFLITIAWGSLLAMAGSIYIFDSKLYTTISLGLCMLVCTLWAIIDIVGALSTKAKVTISGKPYTLNKEDN